MKILSSSLDGVICLLALSTATVMGCPLTQSDELCGITTEIDTASETEARIAPRDSWINDCAPSIFIDQTSDASPFADDCLQLVENIRGGGTWHLATTYHRELAKYKSCHFGADMRGMCLVVHIGNGDIIDAIERSVREFKRDNGRVGARGVFRCECSASIDLGKYHRVDWGIY